MTRAAPPLSPETGLVHQLSPLVQRVLAPNPSPFTYEGTQTYLVGTQDVAVIDPGPAEEPHLDALMTALGERSLTAIMCTHTHRDHSPAARVLAQRTGAQIIGCAPLTMDDDGPRADAAFDPDYAPDRVMADAEQVTGRGWTLTAVATPGHTSNHLCYALEEEQGLFTGDHIMGWSTSVVSPPDGDMADYLSSLERLMKRDDRIYYPAHGEPITQPQRFARGMLGHRRMREGQILRLLEREGAASIPEFVAAMYAGLGAHLHGAAGRSVLAHLIDLRARSLVSLREDERWALAAQ